MNVLITGAHGFMGRNLAAQLSVLEDIEVVSAGRESRVEDLRRAISQSDFVCHLAGVNRPDDVAEFARVNTDLTRMLCEEVEKTGRRVPIVFASSIQAEQPNPYGRSKLAAEQALLAHRERSGLPVHIFRLPNVFGKWSRPNYNSVVATFCHNTARGLPITINDPASPLTLVYIDDVVSAIVRCIRGAADGPYCDVEPKYLTTVGELAVQIAAFRDSRDSLVSEPVGTGLVRGLYATYLSYLRPEEFSYPIPRHADPRGVFVEMLKTKDSGQFSFFTAFPGVTRGGHYHHSKCEKFLVVKGRARFRFRNLLSNETHEVVTSGEHPEIVEMVPGWTHDITNVGDDEMTVMLWANEIFDRARPDTYVSQV